MIQTWGFAAHEEKGRLGPWQFERRDPRPNDVVIEILFCGVCHTDIHQVSNDWGGAMFPMVPGHEIVGRVTRVGSAVTKFKPGDAAGVGCMVNSCRTCRSCEDGEEQYCEKGSTFTYNSPDPDTGGNTYGGYSSAIVVPEDFVLRISPEADLAAVAPLLCAGITTYSPLRHWNIGPGMKVGIVGLGGLGHMGLKFARSFGAHVVQFTTSLTKKDDALRLGAHEVVLSKDAAAMEAHTGSFDFILDTVSAPHDLNALTALLRKDSTLTLVGVPDQPPTISPAPLIFRRAAIAGSLIGGIRETQEMLDYCAEKNITSDVEVIRMDQINEAYGRMLRNDVKYRFSIDMSTLSRG
jgi:uncharacterized zinc-type alcohol dehydrogenase-like protein